MFVRYRNHFPVVQFQNQAHIRNSHDPVEVFKTTGAAGARKMGRHRRPNFFFFLLPPPKAAQNGRRRCPNFIFISYHRPEWGAHGAPFFFFGGGFPNGQRRCPKGLCSPRGQEKSRRRRVLCQFFNVTLFLLYH